LAAVRFCSFAVSSKTERVYLSIRVQERGCGESLPRSAGSRGAEGGGRTPEAEVPAFFYYRSSDGLVRGAGFEDLDRRQLLAFQKLEEGAAGR